MLASILVVTSEPGLGEALRSAWQIAGDYGIIISPTAPDALAQARRGQAELSLAILDILLPGAALPDLAYELRRLIPRLRIVVLLPPGEAPNAGAMQKIKESLTADGFLSRVFSVVDLQQLVLPELISPVLDRPVPPRNGKGPLTNSDAPPPRAPLSTPDAPAQEDDDHLSWLKTAPAGDPNVDLAWLKDLPAADQGSVSQPSGPAWLQDVSRAAQHLTRLSLEANALAALITWQGALWAYAGQLPQDAAQELARVVTGTDLARRPPQTGPLGRSSLPSLSQSASPASTDLARFVRLESTGGEYMLYATGLGAGVVLALAFDAETPFSKIRAQASHLARSLATAPENVAPFTPPVTPVTPGGPASQDQLPDMDGDEDEDGLDLLPDEPIFSLDYVPPPTPSAGPQKDTRAEASVSPTASPIVHPLAPEPSSASESQPRRKIDWPLSGLRPDPSASSNVSQLYPEPETITQPPAAFPPVAPAAPDVRTPSAAPQPVEKVVPASTPAPVRPQPVEAPGATAIEVPVPAEDQILQPESLTLYSLHYACVLVPRMSHQHLTGRLASQLNQWVRQFSQAYSWRLEYLSVRPNYVVWISNVPPDTSPGLLVKLMRRHTSQQIFAVFPELVRENPSGDFWHPAYLVVAATQPPPAQVIKDFLVSTRRFS